MSDSSNPLELSAVKRALLEIRSLRARVATLEQQQHAPIAIVGMGLRFPGGAVDADSFWQLLRNGVDAVGEVPVDRWNTATLHDPDNPDAASPEATRFGAFLRDIDQFDAPFFAISPREAESMDPQQRLLLEVTWEALEHAAIAPDSLYETDAGVFLGISNSDYMRLMLRDANQIDSYVTTGSAASVAAGRISYTLGLRGPSIAFDTACSSSLVAIHAAMQSLRSGSCSLALAGGVNLMLSPELTLNFARANMLAADGHCKSFDAAADGYVRAEGCAMIVLKRLDDALAAGDRVLAVIRGVAVNQDGRSSGITAPNGPAQEAVLRAALADGGVDANAVDYVEAHGTGTPLGDPIEVGALVQVLGAGRPAEDPLLIGSVKTNLGHTEAAAGIAGLIKTVLALQHNEIPPHLHLATLNPHIAALGGAIHIPRQPTAWPVRGRTRIAGVSSFGLSGTNAHLVVEEAPGVPERDEAADGLHVVALSARSASALGALATRYAAHLEAHPELHLADIACTANLGRAHLAHRAALVSGSVHDLRAQLEELASNPRDTAQSTPGVVFLFTGQGAHYPGMGRALYATETVFRASLDESAALLAPLLDQPLDAILFGAQSEALLSQMRYAQPALCALQVALCALWQSWGIAPAAVAGHSAGEYAAAIVAGVMSHADGLALIAERGRLMDSLAGAEGRMVALFAPEPRVADAVAQVVARMGNVAAIAAVNGPTHVVISGRSDAVQAVIAELGLDDEEKRPLEVGIAAHSPLMEPILGPLAEAVARIRLTQPQVPFVSTLTGDFVQTEVTDPAYWQRQMRAPVRFAHAVETLHAAGHHTYVEIGPHPTLIAMAQRCLADDNAHWAPSLSRNVGESETMLAGLATLYGAGADIDWRAFHANRPGRRIALPTYAWEHQRYWSPAAAPLLYAYATLSAPTRADRWNAAVTATRRQADQGPLDLHLDDFAATEARLDRLALAYIVEALRSLAAFALPGACWSVDALLAQTGIAATYRHLLVRWLNDLVGAGLLRRDIDGRFCADALLPTMAIPAMLAEVQAAAPAPLIAYLQRCGTRLRDVLTGSESALATLFPDGSYDTVDFLYSEWAAARYMNAMARAATEAIVQTAQAGAHLRILEIGAGTGGMAAALLPALPKERTRYLFTDVSDFFLTRAAERFADYPFVEYALLNIEESPEGQGVAPHGFDLVVAANVLHATRDLDTTLRHAQALLAPGGVLLLYEATRHPRWLSVTTGLIEGWQRFADAWRSDQPLLDARTWEAALRANGFVDVAALPGPNHPAAVLGQHLLLACAPRDGAAVDAGTPVRLAQVADGSESATHAPAPLPEAQALQAALATALPSERNELLVAFVRQSIAHVLRLRDWQSLKRDQPLLDLGFDSLMAIELRNVLRQGLALPGKLPATLIFDYPSIGAIAAYLERMRAQSPPDVEERSPQATSAAFTPADDLAALSDDEVEAMLLKKLAQL